MLIVADYIPKACVRRRQSLRAHNVSSKEVSRCTSVSSTDTKDIETSERSQARFDEFEQERENERERENDNHDENNDIVERERHTYRGTGLAIHAGARLCAGHTQRLQHLPLLKPFAPDLVRATCTQVIRAI